jgi:hypothetical protein
VTLCARRHARLSQLDLDAAISRNDGKIAVKSPFPASKNQKTAFPVRYIE